MSAHPPEEVLRQCTRAVAITNTAKNMIPNAVKEHKLAERGVRRRLLALGANGGDAIFGEIGH